MTDAAGETVNVTYQDGIILIDYNVYCDDAEVYDDEQTDCDDAEIE